MIRIYIAVGLLALRLHRERRQRATAYVGRHWVAA